MTVHFQATYQTTIVVLVAMLTHTTNAQETDIPKTVQLQIGSQVTLTFHRVSPTAYGFEYPDFFVLESEVTNAQFKTYLVKTGKTKDDTEVLKLIEKNDAIYSVADESAIWRETRYPEGLEDHPVALVTLSDATNFANWLTQNNEEMGFFRLPTWNEWMITTYGKSRAYPWGDKWDPSRIHTSYGFEWSPPDTKGGREVQFPIRTEPALFRKRGATPEGIYGLLGNVREYVHPDDPNNSNYFDLGSRFMGFGFTDGLYVLGPRPTEPRPQEGYWGYSHSALARESDLGFRVILDTTKTIELIRRSPCWKPLKKWSTTSRIANEPGTDSETE
jgi:formylglycine-generating enzyme required for sulfatase activity